MRARILIVASSLLALSATAACSSPDHPDAVEGGIDQQDAITIGTCGASPQAGCPCDDAGATAECTATRVSGSYTTCSPGTLTCGDAGKWGECVGPRIWQ